MDEKCQKDSNYRTGYHWVDLSVLFEEHDHSFDFILFAGFLS